jgi:large subunit ribosomal protein L33
MPGRKWPAGLYLPQGREEQEMRDLAILACGECKNRNYTTTRNKKTTTERLEKVKFCPHCRKRTTHKETK